MAVEYLDALVVGGLTRVVVGADIAHLSRRQVVPKKIAEFLGEEMNKRQYRTGLEAKVGRWEGWDGRCEHDHGWDSWYKLVLDAVDQENRGRLADGK